MFFNIEDLKKKIIYRSNYRGTKEMDKLLGAFTKKYINILEKEDLINLSNLIDYDDEKLYNINQGEYKIKPNELNKVIELFKNFNMNK